jgi:arylsulfatase
VSALPRCWSERTAPDGSRRSISEIFGNRAIHRDDWLAVTIHRVPWDTHVRHGLAEDVWELQDVRADFSLVNVR